MGLAERGIAGLRTRWREGAAALLLVAGVALFAAVGNQHYPIADWLFWHYAVYWLASLACVVACFGIGSASLRALGLRGLRTLEHLSLAFALGLFEFELAMFLLGALHLYRAVLFFTLPIGLVVVSFNELRSLWSHLRRRERRLARYRPPLGSAGALALAFGFVGLLAVYFMILSPENVEFDSRWKHLALAEDYVSFGGIRPLMEGWMFDARPHFTSYLYAWAFLLPKSSLFDRMLLSAHLEFVAFLVTTLVGIPALVRRLAPRADPRVVWAARFLFPGVLLYDSSLAAGADHFGAMYGVPICLATLFAWRALSARWCVLLGALLAAATLVKETTALLLVPIPVIAIAVRLGVLQVRAFRAPKTGDLFALMRGPLFAAATALLCSAPLWLTNWLWHGDPLYPALNRYLSPRPWTSESAYKLKWAYEEANLWQPSHDLSGLLSSLKALATFSFLPNDWSSFHGKTPVFGSLFTLLIPALLFCRARLRLWLVIGWVHAAIFCWFWIHHQDRYLQGILPLMTAATCAAVLVVWRTGLAARCALSALIGLQVVWGGDVYFIQTHPLAKSPLKKSIDLLSAGFERKYEQRFSIQEAWQQVARVLPKRSRVVVHDENNHLGLEAQVVMDRFPFEYGISYGLQQTPADVFRLYRSLGATHILWNQRSKGTDSLAGDIMFWDFVIRRAPSLGIFGSTHLSKMPDAAPAAPFNPTVAVFPCPGSYPAGFYRVSDLRVPVYGPQSSLFPAAPRAPLGPDWPSALEKTSEIVVADLRCFQDAARLTALGYEKIVDRGHPPGTRGQDYSLWLKH
ncbi:MAG TPA: hypothetical protein VGI10_20935 [Polyangiaceae bacterium]|jgi:hypothetical protein